MLNESIIKEIEDCMERNIPIEIHREKGQIVIIELKRKLRSKTEYNEQACKQAG